MWFCASVCIELGDVLELSCKAAEVKRIVAELTSAWRARPFQRKLVECLSLLGHGHNRDDESTGGQLAREAEICYATLALVPIMMLASGARCRIGHTSWNTSTRRRHAQIIMKEALSNGRGATKLQVRLRVRSAISRRRNFGRRRQQKGWMPSSKSTHQPRLVVGGVMKNFFDSGPFVRALFARRL